MNQVKVNELYNWGQKETGKNTEVVDSSYHYNTDGKEIELCDQDRIKRIIYQAIHFFSPKNDTPSVFVCTNEQKDDKGNRLIEYIINLNVSHNAIIKLEYFALLERQFEELSYHQPIWRNDDKTGTVQITFFYPSAINGIIKKDHITLIHSISIPLMVTENSQYGPVDDNRDHESVSRPRKILKTTKTLNGEPK